MCMCVCMHSLNCCVYQHIFLCPSRKPRILLLCCGWMKSRTPYWMLTRTLRRPYSVRIHTNIHFIWPVVHIVHTVYGMHEPPAPPFSPHIYDIIVHWRLLSVFVSVQSPSPSRPSMRQLIVAMRLRPWVLSVTLRQDCMGSPLSVPSLTRTTWPRSKMRRRKKVREGCVHGWIDGLMNKGRDKSILSWCSSYCHPWVLNGSVCVLVSWFWRNLKVGCI